MKKEDTTYSSEENRCAKFPSRLRQLRKEYGVSHSLTDRWKRKYLVFGEESLENQKKPGNPLCKYSNKKNLSKEEQLEYENMKLRIENELLKKGYLMKGDGTIVKFTK